MDEPLRQSLHLSSPYDSSPKTFCHYLIKWLSYITVEPTMVLYMMAFMITSVVEQSFFVYKACTVNHGYNDTICKNINNKTYENITKEVQITVSTFHQWNDIAGHVGQILLAFFMGAWSDRRGRKLPLLMGLLGKLYYSVMIVVNSLQPTWPVEYIVYTATLPMAFTGADVAIFAAAFTYLVDITDKKRRTMRVTILEVCYLATMPIGIALGSIIYSNINQSYTKMFIINASLLAASIIYSLVRLKWRTSANQKPLSEARNLLLDFFDYNHVVNTAKTLCKWRPNKKRTILITLIIMMALYTFQRDERNMTYLYCQLVFNWSVTQYSTFRTVQSALQDLGLLIAIPLMSRILGWKDTVIIMVGAMAHTIARIFYSGAIATWVFYMGGIFAAFGPIVAPVIRSMVSKIVATSEKGKAFSVLGVADNAIPLISGVLYSKLYNATIDIHPAAIFYLTMASQLGVFLLVLLIHFIYKEDKTEVDSDEVTESSFRQDDDRS
ncbi:proton-coupled folate transporter isoform X2 [Anthonomus grandis grandis]|nr:proton-coupled folate transporter isoform X2 [Anthonomus grandis grandis]XP_050298297.1 proton-coupled folate transporter isoform X2 [Anthonomus grandis grandis]XP_050298298.1 proton-coupled folate transporter isoform X2 [Anthonomus grandis grandis]